MAITSINNNANPYFPADVAKEGSRYVRISDFLKVRVHDNGKVVPFKWYDQGRVMNVHNFVPFIKGSVGRYMTDDDDEIIMSPDAVARDWQGTTTNSHDGGVVDYILEDQMFPVEGIFKGHFGLKDTAGNILTSVNIVFEVLGDDLRMGETTKYYSSELDKMVNEFQVRTDQVIKDAQNEYRTKTKTLSDAVDNLQNKVNSDTTKLINDARQRYTSETQNTHDSLDALQSQIKANRDEQTYIAGKLADVDKSYQSANKLVDDALKTANNLVSAAIDKLMSGKRINITAGYDLNNLHKDVGYASGVVPNNAPSGVSKYTYYVGFGQDPNVQIAIDIVGSGQIWMRLFSGAPAKWSPWEKVSASTTYSNSDIQNMINSHTRGKVSVGYDVENDRVITTEQAYAERELVDRNVATSMGNVIRSIKGEGNYIRNDAVDLHKLFGDGVGITTYVCRNKGTLDVPSYYSDKRGTLIVLNFDNNAFTQIWFPVGTSGKGYNGGDPSCAMRYGEQTGTWTPWAILQTEVKHGGQ